jgi:hypothetical protein
MLYAFSIVSHFPFRVTFALHDFVKDVKIHAACFFWDKTAPSAENVAVLQVVKVFMDQNRLQETTSILLDALKVRSFSFQDLVA